MFDSAFHSFHFGFKPSAFSSHRICPFEVFLLFPLRFQIPLSSIESPLYTHKHKTTRHEWKGEERNQFNPKPPPSLRVIANLLIVMSVSGENCFKCFFLRARPIPLPLVLSYYVRGLNLMPCARRICHNTALTAKHGNVINDTYHFVGQYRHMPVLYRPLHCHRFLTNPLLFIIEQWFWYSVVLSKLLAAFWNC